MGGRRSELINAAPLTSVAAPAMTSVKDTITNGIRKLYLHCTGGSGATSLLLDFGDSIMAMNMMVNGRPASSTRGDKHEFHWLYYAGIPKEGFDVILNLDPKKTFQIDLVSFTMGLPQIGGFKGYPPDIIPGPGDYCNTTQVGRHFVF
jgi:hypothetical protein